MSKRRPTKKAAKANLEKGFVPTLNKYSALVLFKIAGKTLKASFLTMAEADVFVDELALLGIEPFENYPKKVKTKKRELQRRQHLIEKQLEVIAEGA